MIDPVGDRIKANYEGRTRYCLPRRTYTIIRCDGKGFSRYTRKMKKPFDEGFLADMDTATIALCKTAQGCVLGYTQSDEISVLLTDFSSLQTDAWFDGNLQKICSVAASTVTGAFIAARLARGEKLDDIPAFDARVFTIPDRTEIARYFEWRNSDASRNSISMWARSKLSHKQMEGVSSGDLRQKMRELDAPWEALPARIKGGAVIRRVQTNKEVSLPNGETSIIVRNVWTPEPAPIFTKEPAYLEGLIPTAGTEGLNESDTPGDSEAGD